MAMNAHWQEWVSHNLERGCSPVEIRNILVSHRFTEGEIKSAMGKQFPTAAVNAVMDESWKGWVKENLEKGCDPKEIHDILLKNNFALGEIAREMGTKFPHSGVHQLTPELYDALSKVKITRTAERVDTDLVQLYVLDNFMDPDECEQLIAISSERLRPSTVARMETYNGFRTSSTCDLVYMDHPLVKEISIRTGRILGVNPTYSEGIQVQRYEVGQLFKPHMDYFEPRTEDYDKYANVRGNRTWTFMVYLNDTPKGGGTYFPKLEKTFYPKTGRALVWNNLLPDGTPNPNTIHSGEPVEEGHKVIITDWFRELGTGKMIID